MTLPIPLWDGKIIPLENESIDCAIASDTQSNRSKERDRAPKDFREGIMITELMEQGH